MAYKDIPLATDAKSQSQADIRDNFLEIASFAGKDHVDFVGTPADLGKHEQATFTLSADDPGTEATERAIYCKNNSAGFPALWVQNAGAAPAADGIDFTTSIKASEGYTMLPSGIMFIWGVIIINGGVQAGTATFVNGGFPTAALTIQATVTHGGNYSANDTIFSSLTPTKTKCVFSRNNPYTAATIAVKYLAIGY